MAGVVRWGGVEVTFQLPKSLPIESQLGRCKNTLLQQPGVCLIACPAANVYLISVKAKELFAVCVPVWDIHLPICFGTKYTYSALTQTMCTKINEV